MRLCGCTLGSSERVASADGARSEERRTTKMISGPGKVFTLKGQTDADYYVGGAPGRRVGVGRTRQARDVNELDSSDGVRKGSPGSPVWERPCGRILLA